MLKWVYISFVSAIFTAFYAGLGWYIPAGLTPAMIVCERDLANGPFAGSASCRGCHEKFYELWASSHHGLAMQRFTPTFAKQHLTTHTVALTIGQKLYQAHIADDVGYVSEIDGNDQRKYFMEYVMGGKNIYFFLTAMDRGRLQVLPLAYDVRNKEWYDTASSMIRHFGVDREKDEALDWKDPLFTFNSSCYHCHVSQLDNTYDITTDTYQTTWSEPGINCETCHGPAKAHNEAFICSPDNPPKDTKLVVVMQDRGYTAHQVDSSCAPCHAKMMPLTTTFMPGEDYFNHYDLVTLEDPDFYPDGRDLGENYTYTLWRMNPCLQGGQLDCMHCHTSSGRYRFANSVEQANRCCLPCHERHVENAPEHTHHKSDSLGNHCVSCHMPMTSFARMRRSDHSFRPPMPAATQAFGSPNACTLCHADKDAEWADLAVRQWRTRDYQKPILEIGRLIEAARKNEWEKLEQMIAWITHNAEQEIYINSLVRLMRNCRDDRKWPLMIGLLENNPSPLVRSSAAAALGDFLTQESISALLKAAEDPSRLVRIRAAFALASVPQGYLTAAQKKAFEKAKVEFLESTTVMPTNWTSQFNRGVFQMAAGQFTKAIEAFETAHKLRPDVLPPLINIAIAANIAGNNELAEQSLRKALQSHPDSDAVHLNLGLLLAEQQRYTEAQKAFRDALQINDKLAAAAYNLAVILSAEDITEAVYWARKAYENAPEQHRYGYTYALYLNQANRSEEATAVLETLVDQNSNYAPVYHLLGYIYCTHGRIDEGLALFNKGLHNDDIRSDEKVRHRSSWPNSIVPGS